MDPSIGFVRPYYVYSNILGQIQNQKITKLENGNFENPVCNFDAGLTFLANENFQYDFSFGTGINNTMNYMSIGFSWLVNKDVK